MCFGLPLGIVAITGQTAECRARGESRMVSLLLMQDDPPAVGDHLVVQNGYALRRLTAAEAAATWALHDRMLAAGQARPPIA